MPTSPIISYDAFQNSNQGFTDTGGPWFATFGGGMDYAQCGTTTEVWCDGSCLECQILPPDSAVNYHITYNANISINMAQYGDAGSLDFAWAFRPLYTGSNIPAGGNFQIQSKINDITYDDTMASVDYLQFHNGGRSWDGAQTLSHSGSVAVNKGSNNLGYISITIYYTPVAASHNEYIKLFTKGITFKITTPAQNVPAASSPSSAAVTTSTTNNSTSRPLSSTSGSISTETSSFSSSSSSSLSSASSSFSSASQSIDPLATIAPVLSSQTSLETGVSAAAKAGAAVGGVALFALFILAFILYRRRRIREFSVITSLEREAAPVAYPREKYGRIESSLSIPVVDAPFSIPIASNVNHGTGSSPLPSPSTFSNPRESVVSTAPHGAPPLYGAQSTLYDFPPTSPALVLFANANRELISEDLEARLTVAGYLPTDDPDNLSEEEWRTEHNVTKLELMRLRTLYAARQNRNQVGLDLAK